jgi:hypothetical protein
LQNLPQNICIPFPYRIVSDLVAYQIPGMVAYLTLDIVAYLTVDVVDLTDVMTGQVH